LPCSGFLCRDGGQECQGDHTAAHGPRKSGVLCAYAVHFTLLSSAPSQPAPLHNLQMHCNTTVIPLLRHCNYCYTTVTPLQHYYTTANSYRTRRGSGTTKAPSAQMHTALWPSVTRC
jgi:hypothetical protein